MSGGLATSVLRLRGVGPKTAERLAEIGVRRIVDLLQILPRRYVDVSDTTPLDRVGELVGEEVTVRGTLHGISRVPTRRRSLRIVRAELRGPEGRLACVWFNQPYLARSLRDGQTVLLHGSVVERRGALRLENSTFLERKSAPAGTTPAVGSGAAAGRRVGRAEAGATNVLLEYPRRGELAPSALRRLAQAAVDGLVEATSGGADLEASDPIPRSIRDRHRLPSRLQALLQLHRPPVDATSECIAALDEGRSPAHRRIALDQLVGLQLGIAARRAVRDRAAPRGLRYRIDGDVRQRAREMLDFELTAAQKRVVREIADDMTSPHPMMRLVQGDVGCGKTVVAALAALIAAESGHQTVFLAPTELLAEQHASELRRLFAGRQRVALVTSESGDVDRDLSLASSPRVVVGTHALLSESVRLHRPALVVIDEQHRFGVEQRERMVARGERPDVLILTATPIPRSLALLLYGDLDLSVIDELPSGRRPVRTDLLGPKQRGRAIATLCEELAAGGQGYVVFPRIRDRSETEETGEHDGVAAPAGGPMPSLESLAELYRQRLSPHRCAVVTGETASAERQSTLDRFRNGEIDCLLATTVIEVGVDVPNASILVIEGGERFGLAQLHQLRGRVGRGSRPSRCLVLAAPSTELATHRLAAFRDHADGFALAELDLRLRGPGELLGARQSGSADARLLGSLRDAQLLTVAREVAEQLWNGRDAAARAELLAAFGVDADAIGFGQGA
ncbi:MAG: ATP-dependent DNA helicase RecG [Acidobacteria bacterium]|nr:MAG: ATP-dependent DNA helicase RecG [Acidobacteriota bacterium]REK10417.1 MAG: ATP-dependent DNA helicase RecG [Acidobacteriota bacterium]